MNTERHARIDLSGDAPAVAAWLATQPVQHAQAWGNHIVLLRYRLTDCDLAGLETALQAQGWTLDQHLVARLRRSLAHYSEQLARDNLGVPEHNLKTDGVYRQIWQHHAHGDRDDTPEELRRYL
ncbi:MAG TPA: hypothetical protein VLC08_09985 [Chitinolyticbacter sp.]|nr:hypothetical protein [Chitinolyticbacter sp.]